MGLLFYRDTHPGVVVEDSVTADAASALTGYSIQYIRRLIGSGKLEAQRVGRSWLITVESLEAYVAEAAATNDARFGPRVPARLGSFNDANA